MLDGGRSTRRIPDVRTMLERLGTRDGVAVLAIQYAFLLPRTCDPYAAGVQEIVKALQRGLRDKGYHLVVDGGMGPETVAAIQRVSGPRWYDKNWVQLMGNVLYAPHAPPPKVARRARRPVAQGDFGVVGTIANSPLALASIGAGIWYFFLGGKSSLRSSK